ncbi:MAG: anti-sigma factor domain-containing protein [Candidatus Limnocylindrales bacterium]
MIDHREAREMLELAAVQPGGLDRLAAGDTAEAVALAGHLAGCPACSAEADRLRASAGLIRDVVLETPPPELRDRTLALVRAVGRPRSSLLPDGPGAAPAAQQDAVGPIFLARRRRLRSIVLPLGIAASILVAIAGTAAVVGNNQAPALASSQETTAELARVTSWTLKVESEPDVKEVALVSSGGAAARGTLLFSPTSTDLVVIANGLAPAPNGQEYRCWVLLNGARVDVGQMDLGGGLAYWVGPVPGLERVPAGTPFGVSLATVNGPISPGSPVIGGSFGG